jgi:hypothetical protein
LFDEQEVYIIFTIYASVIFILHVSPELGDPQIYEAYETSTNPHGNFSDSAITIEHQLVTRTTSGIETCIHFHESVLQGPA